MKDFSEYVNEGVFDIEKNIEEGPDYNKIIVDAIADGFAWNGTGVDCLGRKVEPGDWVVFLNSGGRFGEGKTLALGMVASVKKQIRIALLDNFRKTAYHWGAGSTDGPHYINRESCYVYKIEDPKKLAVSLARL